MPKKIKPVTEPIPATTPSSIYRVNHEVSIAGLKDECGKGIIEGAIKDSSSLAVRFNPTQFTPEGTKHMMQYPVLNPNGRLSVIFLIPSNNLLPVSNSIRMEKEDVGRSAKKTRRKN